MPSPSPPNDEDTPHRLVTLLKQFAIDGASSEELEYTAELVLDTAEDEDTAEDRAKLTAAISEVLEDTALVDAIKLPSLAEQLVDILLGDEDNEEDTESAADRRRRVRRERLETEFAIGTSCLVVLDEDEEWHPARITKHIGVAEREEEEEDADDDQPIEVEIEFIEFGKKQVAREDEVVLDEDVAGREDADDMAGLCAMCERPMNLTAHHVIPRVTHSKYLRKGYTKEFLNTCIMICRQCHSKIHSTEDNKTLAREYNTLDKIMQHPKIIDWVAYARKQKARVKPRKKSKWPVGK